MCNIKMSTKARKESKFSRCIKAPIRVLTRARDFYVRSVSDCSGKISYGAYGSIVGYPAPHLATLPRSISSASSSVDSDNDLRELIRAASTRSLGKKIESELLRQQQAKQSPMADVNVVPRSQSVAIGRIDEDKPCEFGEDIKMKADLYPRSRSYAVTKRRVSEQQTMWKGDGEE